MSLSSVFSRTLLLLSTWQVGIWQQDTLANSKGTHAETPKTKNTDNTYTAGGGGGEGGDAAGTDRTASSKESSSDSADYSAFASKADQEESAPVLGNINNNILIAEGKEEDPSCGEFSAGSNVITADTAAAAALSTTSTVTAQQNQQSQQRQQQQQQFLLQQPAFQRVVVTCEMLRGILGPEVYESEVAARVAVPGTCTGLAWTPTGGELLFIECTAMPGSGAIKLTGKLGEVSYAPIVILTRGMKGTFVWVYVLREYRLYVLFCFVSSCVFHSG